MLTFLHSTICMVVNILFWTHLFSYSATVMMYALCTCVCINTHSTLVKRFCILSNFLQMFLKYLQNVMTHLQN